MPDEPVQLLGEREYKVVGRNAVFGAKTGEKLTLDLTAEQEAYYLTGGHLKIVAAKAAALRKEE